MKKIALGIGILVCIVVAAAVAARFFLPAPVPEPEVKPQPPPPPVSHRIPPYEVFHGVPDTDPAPDHTIPPPVPGLPRVAIIIDDMGYDSDMARKFLALGQGVTFSILPDSPLRQSLADEAHRKGMEVMLHLPMEPFEYPRVNPGKGALLTGMTPDELIDQLKRDLASVPHIRGVNNHMGSRMTTVSTQLYQIFSILKKNNLFFIDSRTTSETLCRPSARLLQLPFAERDVFLDHVQTESAVNSQLDRLLAKARENGRAIGIGHPHEVTWRVLKKRWAALQKEVRLVPASVLVTKTGPAI